MLNRNTKWDFLLVAICVASTFAISGCRSMPGARMFGLRSEPSAEAMAGSGPTVTYPAPPSSSATPQAIASVAGGTSDPTSKASKDQTTSTTAQVAGFDVSSGYPSPSTNLAAAQANGINAGVTTKPATFDGLSDVTMKTSSYAFGSKAVTPKSDSLPSLSTSPLATSPIATPDAPLTAPSTSNTFAPPPIGTTASTASTPSKTQGFTLPTDSPAIAAITPPNTTSSGQSVSSGIPAVDISVTGTSSSEPKAAAEPSFSTASAVTATAPAATTSVLPPTIESEGSHEGYMPGSTGTASGYPTGTAKPTTSGSFYR